MRKFTIKAYHAVISCDWLGEGSDVLLGVDEDAPEDWWDKYGELYDLDSKIYFYLTTQEMADLKVGDVLNDGDDFTIVEIDKDNPRVFEIEYEEEVENA